MISDIVRRVSDLVIGRNTEIGLIQIYKGVLDVKSAALGYIAVFYCGTFNYLSLL